MSDLKSSLQHIFDELKALEERARKLKNQNLADIALSAHSRIKQLSDHPDLELVSDKKDQQANRDFRRPDDVDLNRDGTLQRAPNSFGTAPDVRK